jgi:CRISPR/Cas system-associated protein Csm6
MPDGDSKSRWEQQLKEAGAHLEEDLRRFAKYINDEIVPDVRRNGSEALRDAAAELHKLAQRMDDHSRRTPPPPPPRDAPKP